MLLTLFCRLSHSTFCRNQHKKSIMAKMIKLNQSLDLLGFAAEQESILSEQRNWGALPIKQSHYLIWILLVNFIPYFTNYAPQ